MDRRRALSLVAGPMAFSLVANLADMLGWRPCPVERPCEAVSTPLAILAAAFPHGLGYVGQLYIGAWMAPIFLLVDLALLVLVWRWLPNRVSGRQVLGLIAAWLALSAFSAWFAPYPVVWALQATN